MRSQPNYTEVVVVVDAVNFVVVVHIFVAVHIGVNYCK